MFGYLFQFGDIVYKLYISLLNEPLDSQSAAHFCSQVGDILEKVWRKRERK